MPKLVITVAMDNLEEQVGQMAMVAELGVKVVEELVVVDITLVVAHTAMDHAKMVILPLTCVRGVARRIKVVIMADAPAILEGVEVLVVPVKVAQESSNILSASFGLHVYLKLIVFASQLTFISFGHFQLIGTMMEGAQEEEVTGKSALVLFMCECMKLVDVRLLLSLSLYPSFTPSKSIPNTKLLHLSLSS